MDFDHSPTIPLWNLSRGVERSRLHDTLLVRAYELLLPTPGRPLPANQASSVIAGATTGGRPAQRATGG